MSHHTLYGVKSLQDYAKTFKSTRDDVSDSALRRNICDRGNVVSQRKCNRIIGSEIFRGIAENLIVKINKFVFLVDFVVLDMEEDQKIPIILRRPFLATAHVMIDVSNKKISFKVGKETVTFDIEKSMKFSSPDDDTYLPIDMVDLTILDHKQEILPSDPLDSFLFEPIINYEEFQPQRRLNPKVQDVVKAEIVKLLDAGLIYAISDSS
ncbi:reverse transcriptase domain-containing protein [Tanacetum coccineum]